MSNVTLVVKTESMVRCRLADQSAGHGMDHVLRVLRTSREIHAEVGGDLVVVELAALLHDVGAAKFHNGKVVQDADQFMCEIADVSQ